MFLGWITRKVRYWNYYRLSARQAASPHQGDDLPGLSQGLKKNVMQIREILGSGGDLRIHEFVFADQSHKGALIYIDGLVDVRTVTESILMPFLMNPPSGAADADYSIQTIRQAVLCSGDVTASREMSTLINGCLSGYTILLSDGFAEGLLISTKGWEKRSITEPQTESVVRGPREGYTENIRTNTALLRRRIKNPKLRMDPMTIGRQTQTEICIAYIDGVANPALIKTVKSRLSGIRTDSVLDSGYIEEYIEDTPLSIFPTIGHTEKPDVTASRILEGRVAIFVDGSPFVLTAPMLFIESFQTAEDYYIRTIYASMMRLLRYVAFSLAVFAPAIYIALTTFHQELIPPTLLFTIAGAREGTPFPAFIEALIMVFSFEVLREAGLRLPRPVGQAVSIVGALVMGEASVTAGLVGAPMVITMAITAVASFIVSEQNDSASIMRLISMVLATFLGGFGIAMCFLGMLVYLASLRSFGIPYFEGFTPSHDLQDSFVRIPLWMMAQRPKDMASCNAVRRPFFIPPLRPYQNETENTDEGKNAE